MGQHYKIANFLWCTADKLIQDLVQVLVTFSGMQINYLQYIIYNCKAQISESYNHRFLKFLYVSLDEFDRRLNDELLSNYH